MHSSVRSHLQRRWLPSQLLQQTLKVTIVRDQLNHTTCKHRDPGVTKLDTPFFTTGNKLHLVQGAWTQLSLCKNSLLNLDVATSGRLTLEIRNKQTHSLTSLSAVLTLCFHINCKCGTYWIRDSHKNRAKNYLFFHLRLSVLRPIIRVGSSDFSKYFGFRKF